jgi:6-phosphogluconolactonase (cycloisomerase 2 family)
VLTPALGAPARLGVVTRPCVLLSCLTLCLALAGCASPQHSIICAGAANVPVCMNPNPLLYASTTSSQILPFSISNTTGALTALTPAAGPANSGSIASQAIFLMFADPANNQVDSYQVNGDGTLMAVFGSPFSLGAVTGGPTGVLFSDYGFFYASEPNGTIVGFSATGVGALTTPVPNSPFAAGAAPAQLAAATLSTSAPGPTALYAVDSANPSGGVLAYTIDATGSLTPVPGSPFLALPNSEADSLLVVNSYLVVSVTSMASLTDMGKVAVLSIDPNSGALTPAPGSPFAVGNSPGAITQDSSNHIFVLNTADHTVSAFNVESNGMLTPIGTPVAAGTATGGIAAYPPYLYVADTNAGSIVTLTIDASTGALAPAGSMAVTSPPLQLTLVSTPAI